MSSAQMAAAKDLPDLPLDGSVVKMKGLPFKATCEDVIKFFESFSLRTENIYLKRHPDGRPNGEAFVLLENQDEARRATQKDRETFGDKFGDRYVRVYPTLDSDVADMQAAVLQQSQALQQGSSHHHTHMDSVVKIKSLPFDATQLDIIQFFDSFKLKPNGVQLVVRSDNRPTGEAFVDFENMEEAGRAIRERDHKVFSDKFGDRYVRLIQVSRKEMQATLALRFGGEGILKMKGIPFKAGAADVRKFFTGYRIKSEGISFIMHNDGRPTGMAFIEFESPQEAVRAMDKDRAKFGPEYGDRFCMLQLVGRHEMDKVVLQKESDSNAHKLLAAALATQAALQNPALQPMLLSGANSWLHVGTNAFGGSMGAPGTTTVPNGGAMLNAPGLAAASQYSAQLNAAAANQGINTFLHQQQQQQQAAQQHASAAQHQQQAQQQAVAAAATAAAAAAVNGSLDSGASWTSSRDPAPGSNASSGNNPQHMSSPLVYYQGPPQQIPEWARMSADGGAADSPLWIGGPSSTAAQQYSSTAAQQYNNALRIRRKSVSYSGAGGLVGGLHHPLYADPTAGGHTGATDFHAGLKAAVGAALAAENMGTVGRLPDSGVYWDVRNSR